MHGRKRKQSNGRISTADRNGEKFEQSYELAQRRKKYARRRRRYRLQRLAVVVLLLVVILVVIAAVSHHRKNQQSRTVSADIEVSSEEPVLDVQLLTPNEYSRPGVALEQINGIVIHYTANQGTSAEANRNYFEGLKDSHETKASSHFIIGLDGEIVQCIPTSEIAYASNDRNNDTVSIECCYENDDGSFNRETYESLIRLTAWLCAREGLSGEDVIRHYDVTGKLCPVYYVDHPDEWEQLRADVDGNIAQFQ